ncbi:amidohydrolase family protein [Pontibacter akesuensis]|uniref:Imidazolonepropionase n=1 Tax=Pontibacter akesuensis TaxID=388950 RepID=A0A1I7K9N6_9BACT|nr:amidohydrolase family protein [Pontibacter akesuensis]GHA73983.1 amidohydrolase [Pontibacter akesuensis]SFU94085.1 Imidazolonepropionase [Pontibacter akesuensis]
MKKQIHFAAVLLAGLAILGGQQAQAQIAVKGETVYTMAGAPIKNGVVLLKDGKIEAVGANLQVPQNYTVYIAKVVTPGLVDAHATVGLAGIYNIPADQQQLEKTAPIQPELRALDAYNPQEELVAWVRDHGVTTINTGHGPGALISGQTMTIKTSPDGFATLMDTTSMVTFTLGTSVGENYNSPKTSAKGMAMLRSELQAAQAYAKKSGNSDASKRPDRNLKMDYLVGVLNGKYKSLITANTSQDIMAALRLAKEFKLDLVLDGAAEAYLLLDEIKAAGVPVILHPTMARANGDNKNMSFETAAILAKAGIPVAIQSGFEQYVPRARVLLFEASAAVANGMTPEQALAAVTSTPAKIIGQDKRVGSLEKGKDADLVLYDGDPFEYTSHVCAVIIDGKVVNNTCK